MEYSNRAQRILVVDDNRDVVNSITRLLEYEGYETAKAYDGIEALEQLEAQTIDLIILDVMMPRMNGLSAMMKIWMTMKIPIIVLSEKRRRVTRSQAWLWERMIM